MIQPFIVGITGGSGSGKTLFLRTLMDSFKPGEICVLSQDNYYKPLHLQPRDENGMVNFDVPDSINVEEYEKDLNALKEGKSVERLEYTFNHPEKKPQVLFFEPAPIIVVEGIFVLYFEHLAKLVDLKIFIDAKEHIKLKRRIERDKAERGIGVEEVLYQYQYHVAPTFEKFILPFKQAADLIIPNNDGFNQAMDILVSYLRGKVDQ
ncbi:MAG TPA: uridine kinase [Cytophagales bacterium]|nr:uridine kinase [Cytophagales bacterium]